MKKILIVLLTVGHIISLAACGGENDVPPSSALDEETSAPTESNSPENDTSSEEMPVTTYDAEAIKEEADKAWNTFLDSVSVLETDSRYDTIMKYYNKEVFARNYANYCGGTEEDYLNLTDFERFVLYTTYVIPVMATQYSDYDTYFGSIAKWNSNVAGSPYNFLNNQNAQEQAEAYKTLMEWQYDFFIQYGLMCNFITGKTSLEENPDYVILDPAQESAEQAAQEQQELQELQEELSQ